jgi:hypothetical protein
VGVRARFVIFAAAIGIVTSRWPDGRRQVCTSGRVRWTAVA